jgi:hypothetical protein
VFEKLISSKRGRYLNFEIGLKRDEIKSLTKIGSREKPNGEDRILRSATQLTARSHQCD